MKIALMRHLETPADISDEVPVGDDAPITENGRARAIELGVLMRTWHWDCIITSSRTRAYDTASCLGAVLKNELRIFTNADLNERSWGVFGKLTGRQWDLEFLGKGHPALRSWFQRPDQGESYDDVYRRIFRFYDSLHSPLWNKKSILIVGHGASCKVLRWVFEEGNFWSKTMKHGDIFLYGNAVMNGKAQEPDIVIK